MVARPGDLVGAEARRCGRACGLAGNWPAAVVWQSGGQRRKTSAWSLWRLLRQRLDGGEVAGRDCGQQRLR